MSALTAASILSLARTSVLAPREGAAALMRLRLPASVGWMALALMAIAAALLSHLSFATLPAEAQAFFSEAMRSPIRTALIQWIAMLVAVQLVHKVGRWRGGTGSLADAVLLVAWLQFILLLLQVVEIVVHLAVPPLGGVLSIASVVLLFWLLTNFVAELHGFRSLALTFAGIILTMLAGAFLLTALFMALFGLVSTGT